jgi:L-alanine-DL-glutamate epimerase-like enolase superfamily enzyme
MSPIKSVEVIPLAIGPQDAAELDGTRETVIVRITDEEGRFGIGESDAPPSVIKAIIEAESADLWSQGMAQMLIGADPVETGALWQRLYEGTIYYGRRGLGIHALSAIDLALHDLAGKQLGLPVYKLLGGARRERLRAYCTIYPGLPQGRPIGELMRITEQQFGKALAAGFRAVKTEVVLFDMVTDAELVDLIKEARHMLGDGITLAIDFGYRWHNWHDAKWVLDRIADCNIYFAEATLQHDDLAGHARLAQTSPIRVCGAEFSATRWEIREWVEQGKVAVVQPDISRCGGLTEIRRIADYCDLHAVQVIPHAWKTGILVHAGMHFHAACAATPMFEFVSPLVFPSTLRDQLTSPEPKIVDGYIELPTRPGLGFDLNEDLVDRLRCD